MTAMENTPAAGLRYLVRGIKTVKSKGITPYALAPICINLVVYGIIMTYAFANFGGWIDYLVGQLPEWLDFIRYLLWPFFVLLLLAVAGYSFTFVANLIASPLNGILSEQVELVELGKEVPYSSSAQDWLLLIPRSVGRELTKWRHFLPIILALLLVTFIPLINTLSPLLWFLFGCWSMAIQYVDYCADNNRQSFGEMREGIARYRFAYLGFGAAVTGMTMIPIVNLMVMPAAVIGATLMWSENNLPALETDSERLEDNTQA